jgi:hypothetical protein
MPRVAIGQRNELHRVTKGRELDGSSPELKLAIVRMRPDAENFELKIWHARPCCDGIAGLSSSKRL